jgi:hypothetical protein
MPNPENIEKHKWKKGVSGNKDGRPKGTENSKTRLLRLFSLVQKKKNKLSGKMEDMTILEQMDMMQILKAIEDQDTKAYDSLLDRFEGKPTQEINQNTNFDNVLEFEIKEKIINKEE